MSRAASVWVKFDTNLFRGKAPCSVHHRLARAVRCAVVVPFCRMLRFVK